ncbi:hypothetical protein [Tunturiibacter psychrotolerans]|uniref:hypothetical protein n=1 Tax=Tunturiibacter psychrotolerans TaxID=3069686 RepID=UPI003D1C9124
MSNRISESFTSNFWVTGTAMTRYSHRAIRMPQVDGMAAFFSEAKLAEYHTQVAALKSTSTHCWGTMTVDQGLHHLNVACGHAHGFYRLEDESYLTARTLFRWILVDGFPEQPVGLGLPTGFKLSHAEHFNFFEEQASY